jgi:hypothetical protein
VKRGLGLLLPLAALAFAPAQIDPKAYLAHIRYLASPELKGRATGSPELEKAASYIAGQFKSFGLKPASGLKSGDAKNYELPFTVTINAHLGPDNHLNVEDAGAKTEFNASRDFIPFSFSSSGKLSGAVVFAGYGITAPNLHYDDYDGLDVKDKIVLILRHEPQEADEKSVFDGKELTSNANLAIKAANAKAHGARGVILVNDVAAHVDNKTDADKLVDLGRDEGPTDAGIFFYSGQGGQRASLAQGRRPRSGRYRGRHRQGSETEVLRADQAPHRSCRRHSA